MDEETLRVIERKVDLESDTDDMWETTSAEMGLSITPREIRALISEIRRLRSELAQRG